MLMIEQARYCMLVEQELGRERWPCCRMDSTLDMVVVELELERRHKHHHLEDTGLLEELRSSSWS
jgi:hypothetical protein